MATVEFRNITKRFPGGTEALRDFSLEIGAGEFVVLVGPSGCGKSTALRLLAGLEDPTEGDILIDGKIVNATTPQQRNIAMVFQDYALYPHMSVRENLDFPLRMAGTDKEYRARKIGEIAEMLNLSTLLARKPAQLSGGQRQRVAMGRALVRDPSVFLLDEPLSNLDAKQRAQIRAEIARLQKEIGKTTLYVTHDQVEAMTLGDRVAVLDQGKLHQVGAPFALYSRPDSIFVARFIGSPGMNILPPEALGLQSGQWRLTLGDQPVELPREQFPQLYTAETPRRVTVGFRPESVRRRPGAESIEAPAKVVASEFLGHETLVFFEIVNTPAAVSLVARLPGRYDTAEGSGPFFIDRDSLHFFREDGRAIRGRNKE